MDNLWWIAAGLAVAAFWYFLVRKPPAPYKKTDEDDEGMNVW